MCHGDCRPKTTQNDQWWQNPEQRKAVKLGDIIQRGDVWFGQPVTESSIGNEYINEFYPLYRRITPKVESAPVETIGTQIITLLKKNPDLLNMADQLFNILPAAKRTVEDFEIAMLKVHIASKSSFYVDNRAIILALYNRLGFDEAAAMVTADILRG